jgi:hypothetical protein
LGHSSGGFDPLHLSSNLAATILSTVALSIVALQGFEIKDGE